MNKLYLAMAPVAAVVSGVVLGIAIYKHRKIRRRRGRCTARAEARVAQRRVSSGLTGQRPVVHYVYEFMVNGVVRQAAFFGAYRQQVGDIVSVFYDPACPETIYIPEFQHWGGLFGLYFIGGCWALMVPAMLLFGLLGWE